MRDQAVKVVGRNGSEAQVVDLGDPRACEIEVVGGKAARLSMALRAGLPVPDGFVVIAPTDCSAAMVEASLAALGDRPVAVRSSAVDEDGEQASFAGQHRTVLAVRGAEEVARAVRACAASVLSIQASTYRVAVGVSGSGTCAVVVQEFIAADRSIVAFTVDPIDGRSMVVVEACFGLGEPLVSGSVTPDSYVVDAPAGRVLQRQIALKETMLIAAPDSLEERDVTPRLRDAAVLSDAEAVEVGRLALELESFVSGPVDIEASYRDQQLFLLQARPVTAVARADSFPVASSDPSDGELVWGRNPGNFPAPVSPLHADYLARAFVGGINSWYVEEGIASELSGRRINTYWYMADLPTAPREPTRDLDEAIAGLDDLWNKHYLPEIQSHLSAMNGLDLDALSTVDLMAHLDGVLERARRVWALHFLMLTPVLVALYEFESFCSANLAEAGVTAHDLLSGLDNKTAQMTRELAALGEKYRSDPDLTEPVQDFLSCYGARCDGLELMLRSWSEDESALRALILVYSSSVSAADDEERPTAAAIARTEAVERARVLLRDTGEIADAFEAKLAAAEFAAVLSEDHAFEIDYPLRFAVRRAFLEAGKRLSRAGAIDRPEDVFMLELAELRAVVLDSKGADLRALVLARRSEMARWKRVIAPVKIGDGSSLDDDDDDRISRAYAGYLGLGGDHGHEGTRIMGKPASPGRVIGTARVLRNLQEISRLTPGDILVVSTTSPAWTPVFRAVSGVVTDIGGTLSHAAIVARELGIPAVVATRVATAVVVDGQRIEVNGSDGHVRLL